MTTEQKLREAFEARMTDNGKWPRAVEQGRNGCYLLAQTENAWAEWQACAEALATTEPTGKQRLQVEPSVNQQLTTGPVDELPEPHAVITGKLGAHCSFNSNELRKGDPIYTEDQMRAAMANGANQ